MVADARGGACLSPNDVRWKRLLTTLCILLIAALFGAIVDVFGVPGGKPWFGFWDSVTDMTGRPFVAQIIQTTAGGAAMRAGLRDGDRVDLRRLTPYERVALVYQPVTTRTMTFTAERNGKPVNVAFVPSTVYDGGAALKIVSNLLWIVATLVVLCCALAIALRRARTREGRYLCLTLLAIAGSCVGPNAMAVPNGIAGAVQIVAWGISVTGAAIFPVLLAMSFGRPSRVRRLVEIAALVVAAVSLAGFILPAVGLLTLAVDPLPFIYGAFWRSTVAVFVLPVAAVAMATAATAPLERARVGWLLLPLPIALLLSGAFVQLLALTSSWGAYMSLNSAANAMLLLGAAAVTFAMLKRRVLDFQFVLGRTLVVAGVSAIVVVSFVLLEWLLGTVVANVSHATGLIANASLALALGLSMSFIHKRVDALVDFAFFHRRVENERALRDFAKEAPFVTRRDELLDHTIAKLRLHTDAGEASVLIDGDGRYRPVRWFGDEPAVTSENDAAILALKAKRRPIDPHGYATALRGDVVLPMLAAGRLFGVLMCGRRAGGEAYAPDEIDALGEFAAGVGVALEAIDRGAGDSRDDAILAELRAIREQLASLKRF